MSNSSPDPGKGKKGLSTQAVALIIASVVIISAAAVIITLLMRPEAVPIPAVPDGGNYAGVITEENVKDITDQAQEKARKGTFTTHMTTTWRFPDGSSPSSDAVMGNSEANTYPMFFEIILKDTDEVVFTSGALPVGTQISEITLNRDLDEGTYPAVVSVHMIDENGEPTAGNAGFNITLVVQS